MTGEDVVVGMDLVLDEDGTLHVTLETPRCATEDFDEATVAALDQLAALLARQIVRAPGLSDAERVAFALAAEPDASATGRGTCRIEILSPTEFAVRNAMEADHGSQEEQADQFRETARRALHALHERRYRRLP